MWTKTLALAAALTFAPTIAEACHLYSRWYYPRPQHCGGVYARAKTWFVDITQLPADVRADQRSAEDILDQAEHDKAVADHKDEINFLMGVLRGHEAQQNPVRK